MAIKTMADNGTPIQVKQDAVLYAAALGKDLVFSCDGKLACSAAGLVVTVNTGECAIAGRHVTLTATETITLEDNTSGYICVRYDLTQSTGNEARIYATPNPVYEDLNNGGSIRDLVLYSYVTSSSTVTLTDKRDTKTIYDGLATLLGGGF